MNNAPGRFRVFLANLVWLLACLPGWIAFLRSSRNIQQTQQRLLRRILKQNAATTFGQRRRFASITGPDAFRQVPLSEYEDYREAIAAIKGGQSAVLTSEPVELLQPTSGSICATKLIPYTQALQREFKVAVDPWIASLYLAFPSLLFGRHYWSISPATPPPADPAAKIRIGFADDSEYLGTLQRLLTRTLFAVPGALARVKDQEAFEYLTLLFLCREKNLRLISVWHPSFLTVLLQALPRHLPALRRDLESGAISPDLSLDEGTRTILTQHHSPCPKRARELERIELAATDWPQALWPQLRVISCWTDGIAEPWVSTLARAFPNAAIQGKGLTATEGIVSFPLGRTGQKVCAARSHYLEFIDPLTGKVQNAWDLEAGREYSVVMTTGGGLYRYRLHDRVRVTGFYHEAPCFDFIARDNLVSDMVGEKLNASHVESAIRHVEQALGRTFAFAMLAPHRAQNLARYVLFVETAPAITLDFEDFGLVARVLEEELTQNYHYRHARRLSQLQPLDVYKIENDAVTSYRRHLMRQGMKAGDIKFQRLSTDPTWLQDFSGQFVA